MNRRDFAKSAGWGVLAMPSLFNLPWLEKLQKEHRSKQSNVPLGVCNHSLRSLRLSARQLIDYAIDHRLDSVLINTLRPFESLVDTHLSLLKKKAAAEEISIYIGIGSISEKSTKFSKLYRDAEQLICEGIRVASMVSSPIVGCRIGSMADRYSDGGIEAHIDTVVALMKSISSQVRDSGIKFAFENHAGDLRSEELLTLINAAGTDICGALFDPANAVWALENPMTALEKLEKNIICTSVRDVQVWETEEGITFQGMAIGEGLLDYKLFSKTLLDSCPGVPLHVETISNSARQVKFLRSEFWKGFPNLLTDGIIDVINLAKKGASQTIMNPPEGKSRRKFDIKLQKSELLKSFEYLRKHCNAGLKS